ncbi:MAG: M28 family peptidase [Deltaproteobacteria bacterium]|nr:M28 family peptidase [Deltaproteobacteria bacterium]
MSLVVCGVVLLLLLTWVWGTQPLFFTVERPPLPPVSPAQLATHVRMLSETFFPRDITHPDNLDRAATYIRHAFERARGRVSEQPYTVAGRTYRNVLALFGPDTKERIVVGAHYDTAGIRPGADDNASGVAGLIELASLLRETSLPLCVELVAFTLEEEPHLHHAPMGSAVHATSLRQHNIPVRVMFSLEMIGYFTDAPHSQRFPLPFLAAVYPSQGNFIAIVGNLSQGFVTRQIKHAMRSASPLPVYSFNAPRFVPGVDFSDHRNYWQAGYPAVMVTDTAFYRNEHYHTMQDTADTLDYQRMALVVQGVYAAVVASARAKSPLLRSVSP